jgi:hypothetical protein
MIESKFKIINEGHDTMSLVLEQFQRLEAVISDELKKNPKAVEQRDPRFLFYQGLQNSLALVAQYHDQVELQNQTINRQRMVMKIQEEEIKELREVLNRHLTAVEIDISKTTIIWKQAMKERIKKLNELNQVANDRTGN